MSSIDSLILRCSLFQQMGDSRAVSLDMSTAKTLWQHLTISCHAASVLLLRTHGLCGTLAAYDDSQNVRMLGTRSFMSRAFYSLSLADDTMQSFGVSTQSTDSYLQNMTMTM